MKILGKMGLWSSKIQAQPGWPSAWIPMASLCCFLPLDSQGREEAVVLAKSAQRVGPCLCLNFLRQLGAFPRVAIMLLSRLRFPQIAPTVGKTNDRL